MRADRIACRRSTSKRWRCTRTIRRAERCAGLGANQSAFAIEQLLDRLAKKVGIDGWEMRWRNILQQGDRFATGQKLDKPFGLKETLLAVKDAYRGAKYAGIACGIKNCGIGNGMPDPGKASLRVEADGKVSVRTGYTEMGQGLFTVTIQTAVEETGLPPETFTAHDRHRGEFGLRPNDRQPRHDAELQCRDRRREKTAKPIWMPEKRSRI